MTVNNDGFDVRSKSMIGCCCFCRIVCNGVPADYHPISCGARVLVLSSPDTRTFKVSYSLPQSTCVYPACFWLNPLRSGRINRFSNLVENLNFCLNDLRDCCQANNCIEKESDTSARVDGNSVECKRSIFSEMPLVGLGTAYLPPQLHCLSNIYILQCYYV